MIVLGLHGGVTIGQHEPGAALAVNGKIVAACEEERYLRIKQARGMLPHYSINACLREANVAWEDIDLIVTPGSTYNDFEPRVRAYLTHLYGSCPRIERMHHQLAHLSAAYYGSGFDRSLVLSLDATGDGACGMLAKATRDGGIEILETIPTDRSLGYFYTLMTYFLGFEDGDEYKVMGLAPYGQPDIDLSSVLKVANGDFDFDWSLIRSEPKLMSPFEPTYTDRLRSLVGRAPRRPGAPVEQFHKDLARSTQAAFEEAFLCVVQRLKAMAPDFDNLCYAGGVALNCSANRTLAYSGEIENFYVSPASSDRGLAIGCAYYGAVQCGDNAWPLATPYLGSSYSNDVIRAELDGNGVPYTEVDDPARTGAELIADGKILGWFQGRSEIGARALGHRSILARCDAAEMRDKVNARIKYREEFRPFAPSAVQEDADRYFVTGDAPYPYMCVTVDAREEHAEDMAAIVHVDGTARLQTVRSSDDQLYYELIRHTGVQTGTPVVLNTSFNLKGQPIVETPRDALMTFFGCGLDNLILGNFVVGKST
ncbi:MAG: carbamoyltransferase C-terminal domain-containing protein [Pseudomonadota bacterium]